MAVQWYYKMAGKEFGPFTSQELKQLAEEKRIAPTDPVRRETDVEWSLARNVKGLFPAQSALPVGVAVPVTPVKEPPVVVPAVKKTVRPPKVEEPEEESFDFGFDSSVSQGTKSHKTSTAKRPPSRPVSSKSASSKPASRKKGAAEEEEENEKKPLTKKEIQKRNFMIIAAATGAVIVLAILILVIASCKGSSKPKACEEDAVVAEETLTDESAETSSEDEKSGAEDAKADEETEKEDEKASDDKKADEDEKAEEESTIPPEFAEEGYKTPFVDGKWQSCTFGSAKVFIRKIKNAQLGAMNKKATKNQDREYCFIKIEVQNASEEGLLLNVPGWGAKGTKGVKLFAGKNQYTTQKISVPDQADSTDQIDVGEKFTDVLVFNAPKLETIDALRLELPPLTTGDPVCKLYLPKEMFQKKAATVEGEDVESAPADGEEEKAEAEESAEESADESAEEGEKVKSEESKPKEKKAPSALDDESLGGETVSEAPAAAPAPSKKDADELGGASEENIDILNDPSLM